MVLLVRANVGISNVNTGVMKMSVEIKHVKAKVFSVKKDDKLIGRITSDGSFGFEPADCVTWLSLDELQKICAFARLIPDCEVSNLAKNSS